MYMAEKIAIIFKQLITHNELNLDGKQLFNDCFVIDTVWKADRSLENKEEYLRKK